MKFRECINCQYVSCTVYHRCLLIAEQIVRNPPDVSVLQLLPPPKDEDMPPDDEPPCTERYSHDGLCPCCGVEVERFDSAWGLGGFYDECMSCGWQGDLLYDI